MLKIHVYFAQTSFEDLQWACLLHIRSEMLKAVLGLVHLVSHNLLPSDDRRWTDCNLWHTPHFAEVNLVRAEGSAFFKLDRANGSRDT